MKRLLAVAALLSLTAAGCGGSDDGEPGAARNTPLESATAMATTTILRPGELRPQDRAFLALLNDYWRDVDNADVIEGGEIVCDRFRAGDTAVEIMRNLGGESGGDPNSLEVPAEELENLTNFVHAATTAYCPEYLTGVR